MTEIWRRGNVNPVRRRKSKAEKIEIVKRQIAEYFGCTVADLTGENIWSCIEQMEDEAPWVEIYWGELPEGIEHEVF